MAVDMRINTSIATNSSASSLSVYSRSHDTHDLAILPDLADGDDPSLVDGSHRPFSSWLSIAEGAVALTILYALIGAGIGAVAGAALLGLAVGFATGVAAIAAILLISGASAGAERHVDRVIAHFPHQASGS
jgi:hypothetical protein